MAVNSPGPLVLVETGAIAALEALASSLAWLPTLRYGLYSNDWWPAVTDNVGRYVPAQFPGYSGLQYSSGWGSVTLQGYLAVISGTPITWTRSAGQGLGWIGGYYVVDATDTLIMACRFWGYAGTIVGTPGQNISVVPTLGLITRYQ